MSQELIERSAIERIIQRAAELQAAQRDIGEGLTEAELLALGKEVGIPDRFLRQALLEEQAHAEAPPVRGFGTWLAGPDAVTAERAVPGTVDEAVRALDTWMRTEEAMATLRRSQGHLRWERQPGFFAEMRRSFGVGGRPYALARADDVAAYAHPIDERTSYVRLVANVQRKRSGRIGGAAALLTGGALLSSAAIVAGFLPMVGAAPLLGGAALALPVLRRHRHDNARIQMALERVLDRLESGGIKPEHEGSVPGVLNRVADELRKALQPFNQKTP